MPHFWLTYGDPDRFVGVAIMEAPSLLEARMNAAVRRIAAGPSRRGAIVLTIEGLANGEQLHPMQEAFRENHGLRCGFCAPGMIMTAVDMVNRLGHTLEEHTIREELEGNICRCTGYHNIVKSIAAGAKSIGSGGPSQQAAEESCRRKTLTRHH
jgi:xanthine dehydrogenase iron-sulfur cluster and FAD-binding subunit A